MARVAAGRFEMARVAALERAQIAWQVLQLRLRRRTEKARIHERIAFGAQLRGEARVRRRHGDETLRQREVLMRDGAQLSPSALRHGRKPRARTFHLLAPRGLVAWQRIVADERA